MIETNLVSRKFRAIKRAVKSVVRYLKSSGHENVDEVIVKWCLSIGHVQKGLDFVPKYRNEL